MPTCEVDNQRLFYTKQTNPGSSIPNLTLLLLHGAGGTRLDWPPALRRFPGATVIGLDLPGHGRSLPPGRQRIEAYAAVVRGFVAEVALGPTIVIGHSMGGAIALALGLAPPDEFEGLVLISTGPRLPVNQTLLRLTRDDYEAAVALIARYAWGPEAPAALREAGKKRLVEADPAVTYGDFLACDAFDMRQRLPEIGLPALVLVGEADRMTPPNFSETLHETLPRAQLVTMPGAGHMLPLERPGLVSEAVALFLHRLR